MFRVLLLRVLSQDRSEAVVVHLLLVGHHKVSPAFLALCALHLVLVYRLRGIVLGEVLLQMLENLVVVFGQAKSASLDSLKDGPVRLEVLDGCKYMLATFLPSHRNDRVP